MGFAVLHIEKITSGAKHLGNHIDRKIGKEHTYKNADPSLKGKNQRFETDLSHLHLELAIDVGINRGYQGTREIRKDAVKGLSMVLSGSHTEMKEIFKDEQKSNQWLKANMAFVREEFGAANIARFVLHLDEKTPHLHVVIVPITKDGRLSAKEIMGNRVQMSARQTRYAEKMHPFGLERGIVGSKAIHNTEGWYLGQQKKEQEAILSRMPDFTVLDRLNPSRYIENVLNGFKSLGKSKRDTELELSRRNQQLKTVTGDLSNRVEQVRELKLQLNITNHKLNGYTLKPEFEQKFADLQKGFQQEKSREVKLNFNQGLDRGESQGYSR